MIELKDKPVVLLSIDEKWAKAILDGEKQYEYRKQPPSLEPPYYVLLYATRNTSAIVGWFKTNKVLKKEISDLIDCTIEQTPHNQKDIKDYFEGKNKGSAIKIDSFQEYDNAIPVEYLKYIDEDLTIPQNFQYLKPNRDKKLLENIRNYET